MCNLFNVNKDSILVFEYFTASGEDDPSIISEAKEIIRSLILDLKELDVYVLISNKFKSIFDDLNLSSNIHFIKIRSDIKNPLEVWLNENSNVFSRAMFIAAESNMNLYNLTKILSDNDVKVYGSDSYAVKLASDKFETFDYFYGKLKQPETFNILFNPKTYWKRAIQIFFDKINSDYASSSENNIPILQKPKDIPVLDNSDKEVIKKNKLILKPRFGVDGENIRLIKSKVDIDRLEYIEFGSRYVIQEFIEGIVASVSLICDGKTAIPISLNKQIVKMGDEFGKYVGGELPFEHPLKDKAFELAKLACEYVPGIRGFVGVDIILNDDEDEVYLMEINSRFTTSYVGLQKIAKFNIAKTAIELLDGKIDVEDVVNLISYDGKVNFLKDENGILDIKKI